ncbi:hypothetical protein GY45DRAFT_879849 [Cubamyces sp. BRFM 1775]|nr:hypothetical protein GY45DRAFT_879849 [Cubamyces sp. BRFM 1775]
MVPRPFKRSLPVRCSRLPIQCHSDVQIGILQCTRYLAPTSRSARVQRNASGRPRVRKLFRSFIPVCILIISTPPSVTNLSINNNMGPVACRQLWRVHDWYVEAPRPRRPFLRASQTATSTMRAPEGRITIYPDRTLIPMLYRNPTEATHTSSELCTGSQQLGRSTRRCHRYASQGFSTRSGSTIILLICSYHGFHRTVHTCISGACFLRINWRH